MGFLSDRYNRPGPGIPKNLPKKKGWALFWELFGREFFELIKLNLLFLLFCIPVVTIPAAYAAMTRVTVTMVRDETHFLWGDFRECFLKEWKRTSLAGWGLLAAQAVTLTGAGFYFSAVSTNAFFYVPLGLVLLLLFVLTFMSFSLYPMMVLIDLPLKAMLRNAFFLSFLRLPQNALALVANAVIVAAGLWFYPLSLPVLLVFSWAQMNFIATFCAYGGIYKFIIAPTEQPAE